MEHEYKEEQLFDNFILKKLLKVDDKNQIWSGLLLTLNLSVHIKIIKDYIDTVELEKNQIIISSENKYIIRERIGEGTFGVVYNIEDESQKFFVLKIHLFPNEAKREFRFYQILKECPFIPKMYSTPEDAKNNFIILQKLHKFSDRIFNSQEILKIMECLIRTLDYMHKLNIVHGDIKPTNILFDSMGNAYLCDLTNSYFKNEIVNEIGTIWYRAPENIRILNSNESGYKIDPSCDIWSLGVFLMSLLNYNKTPTFFSCNNLEILRDRLNNQNEINELIIDTTEKYMENKDFLKIYTLCCNLLIIDPKKRISAESILKAFFED